MKDLINKTGVDGIVGAPREGTRPTVEGPGEGTGPTGEIVRVPIWKRSLDIALIVLALPLLGPLVALIGAWIRIVSSGPVLFKQERVGLTGGRFTCYKFRTMIAGADTSVHKDYLDRLMTTNVPMVKMDTDGDPRVIPTGRVLRAFGLDELPQLMNVLRGEMSLVGPRPCLPYEYEKYLPWQRERFNAVPGLTGLWQVNGKNRTTFLEMIQLDIRYARTSNVWLDVGIILKTVPALIMQAWANRYTSKTGYVPQRAARADATPVTLFNQGRPGRA